MNNRRHTISDNHCFRYLIVMGSLFGYQQISAAQGLYNASSIFINDVDVFVDGDITNDGVLLNNGSIAFTLDWQSKGPYSGDGFLEATGNGPQKIAHYDQDVYGLVVKGWGAKSIRGGINITKEFHLMEGIVEVSAGEGLNLREGAVIFGGSTQSYVDGALAVEGNGYKFFPVGKNGAYAPIEFLDVKGEPAKFSVEVFDNAPVISVENVIVRRGFYWQRKDLLGSFGGSAIGIDYDPAFFRDPEKMLVLAGTDWKDPFSIIADVQQSSETSKLITTTQVTTPILLLAEISDTWTEADFYFPTAMSPNAINSENRNVKIFGERLSEMNFHLTVFNRWGAVVYETKSLQNMTNNGWDGRSLNGDKLVAGAYPYKLTGLDKTGRRFEKKGVITIMY